MPKTKIIATVGPASQEPGILAKMIDLGLSCIRINSAHITAGYITEISNIISDLNTKKKTHVAIMVDLKGPELRTLTFPGGTKNIMLGKEYSLTKGSARDDQIGINHPSILGSLKPGDTIFMSDGKVSLTVINSSKDQATVSAGDNA
ncbi:MAG: pyruvate kinase, partial [Thermoplasmataceae archaeon]